MSEEKKAVTIAVPSQDPKRKEEDKKGKDAERKLSDEDERIKEQVELLVARAADTNTDIAKLAVRQLSDLLRTSSSGSVASVPKPLKYVRTLFPELEQALKITQDAELVRGLHDVLSFVSMTLDVENVRQATLAHKLKGNMENIAEWGHEYLRFLAGGVADEWEERAFNSESTDYLSGLVDQIVQYMVAHLDEPTALDLLIETDEIGRILAYIDEANYKRIANYAMAISKYLTRPADVEVLNVVYEIYTKMGAYAEAVTVALQLDGWDEKVSHLFSKCDQPSVKLQMALTCARYKRFFTIEDDEDEVLSDANGNMRLSQLYRHSAQALDSMAPKTPEEVLKLGDNAQTSALGSFACTLVSALVNCGYGTDKYITASSTIHFEQREDRIITSIGAHGLLHLWDHAVGLQEIDKYFYSESDYVRAGACLAVGVTMCGVRNPFEPAFGLLSEHVSSPKMDIRNAAVLGLGYAYAGTKNEDVKELLIPILANGEEALETQCMTAYALAMVFVGTADEDITETMTNCLLEIPEARLKDMCVRYLILALGCMFLGCQEAADTLIDATQTFPALIQRYTEIVIRSCAFAATGNVVVIQNLFHAIAEAPDADDDDAEEKNESSEDPAAPATNEEEEAQEKEKTEPLNFKAVAVLGISLVALGEPLGMEMAQRTIIDILLADTVTKKADALTGRHAVPLAYGLLSASTGNTSVVESLNRLAHDSNTQTAANAILAMGLVSAGTNNARVATKLRSLASYYQKEQYANILFVVRLAQGLCAMGKGHLTLSPLLNDRTTVSYPALMGLLGLLHSALDLNKTILDKYHYMLFCLTPSISPRMVLPVDVELNPIDGVQVRIGLPVDTVALPGKPKHITGFQTHTTPVLLGSADKMEVADPQYRAIPQVVEGVFAIEKKPPTE